LNVGCYGREFADEMDRVIVMKLPGAHEVTLAEVNAPTVPEKLHDAMARLFSPDFQNGFPTGIMDDRHDKLRRRSYW
jgi:hypothetical protein